MKAIVLTCDKYLQLADHTIYSYQKVWPDNPFRFRVPYGSDRDYAYYLKEKYGEKIELIQTDAAKVIYSCKPVDVSNTNMVRVSLIKPTVLKLLEDVGDDEWIFWCMDDRYLIQIKQKEVETIYTWLLKISDPAICGFSINRFSNLFKQEHFLLDSVIENNSNIRFIQRRNYKKIWNPCFLRAKVIRTIFNSFPDRPFVGKEMDYFKDQLSIPADQKLFISENNLIVVGESTTRGKLTKNCLESLIDAGIKVPKIFETSDKIMIQGEL